MEPERRKKGVVWVRRRQGMKMLRDIDVIVNCNWVDTRWQYTFG
jgi:hypothetical protein